MTVAQSIFQIVYCQNPEDIKSMLKSVLFYDHAEVESETSACELLKFKINHHLYEFAFMTTSKKQMNGPLFIRVHESEWDELLQRMEFWCYRNSNASIQLIKQEESVLGLQDSNGQKWFFLREDYRNLSELLH